MIVSLSCTKSELLLGTKSSDIFIIGLQDNNLEKGKHIMSGHSDGKLHALAVHRVDDYIFTGGEDKRLMKWSYIKKRAL